MDYLSAGVDGNVYYPFNNKFKSVCGENSVGCFMPEVTSSNELIIKEVKEYTEINAYGVSGIVLSSYLLFSLMFINKNLNKFKEVKNGK